MVFNENMEKYRNYEWLKRRLLDGWSNKQMAEECGCSASTINSWLKKYNLRIHRHPWRIPQLMEYLYAERGMSSHEVAAKLNCDRSVVSDWVKKHGLEPKPKGNYQPIPTYKTTKEGPVRITDKPDYIYLHRLLAVSEWGFDAVKDMHVHHVDKVPWDNRPDNLKLLTPSDHMSHHAKKKHEKGVFPQSRGKNG